MFDFFEDLFSSIIDFFRSILEPVYWFFDGIFYLFGQVISIAVLIAEILYMILQFLFSLISGLVNTLVNVATYNPDDVITPNNPYIQGLEQVTMVMEETGMDIFPLVLIWGVYVITAYSAIKIFKVA